jgi:SnoaL-like domain
VNELEPDETAALMSTFYSVLNAPVGDLSEWRSVLADGWRNHSSSGTFRERDEFSAVVEGLAQAVPDLCWQIDEILVRHRHADRSTLRHRTDRSILRHSEHRYPHDGQRSHRLHVPPRRLGCGDATIDRRVTSIAA